MFSNFNHMTEKNTFNIRSTLSNEHLLFADTLRDWSDPLLHGQEPIHTPLCPRCATCKCQSLKNLPNPPFNSQHHHHHHHIHDPSCPNFHRKQVERRAMSHDPSISLPTAELYESDR